MKTLITIAWRNIWRNRTRSLIIIAAIILGLMGGVFSAAVRLGAEKQQFKDTIENQVSHIQIHHPEFIPNPEARFRIPGGEALGKDLDRRPDIAAVSARTVFDGMAASAKSSAGVRIKGVDPGAEARVTGLDGLIVEGSYFSGEGRLPGILIGRALADKLHSGVGSRIVLTFLDVEGGIVSASFRIEGLYLVTSKNFEERHVFVSADVIRELIRDPEAVTEIAVFLSDPDDYRSAAAALREAYPGVEVRHWADLVPSLFFAMDFLQKNLIWLVGIIMLGVSFGLLNTILMSVLERVRELGVLMAIGMKRAKVFALVVLETTLLALVGGIAGLGLSFGMVRYLNVRGLDLSRYGGEGLQEYGYSSVLYPDLEPFFYVQIAVLVVAFAVLAAVYPAWKAVRLVPSQAVRQE